MCFHLDRILCRRTEDLKIDYFEIEFWCLNQNDVLNILANSLCVKAITLLHTQFTLAAISSLDTFLTAFFRSTAAASPPRKWPEINIRTFFQMA